MYRVIGTPNSGLRPVVRLQCGGCVSAYARLRFPSIATRSRSWASTRRWSRLAYLLAFRLRFDGGIPDDYADLLSATLPYVVVASLLIFTLFGLYEKWWRYVGQRDYLGILQAVVVATLFVPAFNALTHPVIVGSGRGDVTLSVPTGVLALFFLLTLVFVGGARFIARTVYERPLQRLPARSPTPAAC